MYRASFNNWLPKRSLRDAVKPGLLDGFHPQNKHSRMMSLAKSNGISQKPGLMIGAVELAQRFTAAVEETLQFLSRCPRAGRPRCVRFSDLIGYRGLNVFEPFGRFRIYYRIIGEELHAERLLEGHHLAASDDR